jgi:NADH-quinone oxidoreductase subunit E
LHLQNQIFLGQKKQISKYPKDRQQSAVIPLLYRAQEQEGWISKPAIEFIAKMLKMAPIRVYEVASFYFMFHLSPVGKKAHIQICGTTPCMLRGSEKLIEICKQKISKNQKEPCSKGKLSWEEVECIGACSNSPVVQIGSDYYEDLSEESFSNLLDNLIAGDPEPGSQKKRFSSEPEGFFNSTKIKIEENSNASVKLFLETSIRKKTKKLMSER